MLTPAVVCSQRGGWDLHILLIGVITNQSSDKSVSSIIIFGICHLYVLKMGKKSKQIKLEVDDEAGGDESMADKSAISQASSAATTPGDPRQKLELLTEKDDYDALCAFVNPIAHPLASRKLAKKLYKLLKKASKEKYHLRQGVSDVQRAFRKGESGLAVLAGNVSPLDVYCHIPALCEDQDIPYVFTPSKEQLGLACGHRRPTVVALVRPHESYQELFDECAEIVKGLPPD